MDFSQQLRISLSSVEKRHEDRQENISPFQGELHILTSAGALAALCEEHERLFIWEVSGIKQGMGPVTY